MPVSILNLCECIERTSSPKKLTLVMLQIPQIMWLVAKRCVITFQSDWMYNFPLAHGKTSLDLR